MAPYSITVVWSTLSPTDSENDGPCRNRNTNTLIAMIASVTTAKRSVGMLSRRGIKPAKPSGGRWRRGPPDRGLLVGVVRAPHQRPGSNRLEAHRIGLVLEVGELLRRPVADDRQMLLRRTQVLAH